LMFLLKIQAFNNLNPPLLITRMVLGLLPITQPMQDPTTLMLFYVTQLNLLVGIMSKTLLLILSLMLVLTHRNVPLLDLVLNLASWILTLLNSKSRPETRKETPLTMEEIHLKLISKAQTDPFLVPSKIMEMVPMIANTNQIMLAYTTLLLH